MSWTTSYANRDDTQTPSHIFGYNGVMAGVETDSGDIPVSGATHVSFHILSPLTTDYFKVQAKLTNDDTYSDVQVISAGNAQIKEAINYTVDVTGAMFIKFVRVGTADGASSINMTITLPRLV